MSRLFTVMLLFGTGAFNAHADDSFHAASAPIKTARKTTGKPTDGPADKVEFGLWIPDGLKVVRGAIVNPLGGNTPAMPPTELKHWHEACRLWGFALLHANYNGVNSDEFGLDDIALKDIKQGMPLPELLT